MKKAINFVIVFTLLAGVFPFFDLTTSAIPPYTVRYGYQVVNGEAVINSCQVVGYDTSDGDLAFYIPPTLDGYPVTGLSDYAFSNADVSIISLPASIKTIGNSVFSYCSKLSSLSISADSPYFKTIDNVLFDKSGATLVAYPQNKRNSAGTGPNTSYTIPDGVTTIANYAFFVCRGLTEIVFPNSLTSIGDSAFYTCDGLTGIVFPNSLISIGKDAFSSCSGLTEIILPNSLISIGNHAFSECSQLAKVTIPSSVTNMGQNAFSFCPNLHTISIDDDNPSYASQGNILFNKQLTILISYPQSRTEASYIIPASVTEVGNSAFSSCENLTYVKIPNGVTKIGNSAFAYSNLTSVEIPDSVTQIGDNAFASSNLLTIYAAEGSYAWNYATAKNIPLGTMHVITNQFSTVTGKKPITLKLVKLNQNGVETTTIYETSATYQNGYSYSFHIPDFNAGTYQYTVTAPGYTRCVKTVSISATPDDITPEIYAGDLVQDDVINIIDISRIIKNYGQSNLPTETIYDINDDTVINMNDVFVLISNLGRRSVIE